MYLTTFFEAKEQLKYITDEEVLHNFKTLETLNEQIASSVGRVSLTTYQDYLLPVNEITERDKKTDMAVYKARKRLEDLFTKTLPKDLPNLIIKGDPDAVLFLTHLTDENIKEHNLIFNETLELGMSLLLEPQEQLDFKDSSILKYAKEFDFIKQYNFLAFSDNLTAAGLDPEVLAHLFYTIKNPGSNMDLYLAITKHLGMD